MEIDNLTFIKKISLFTGIEDIYLQSLTEILREKKLKKGAVVFLQYEEADALYIIKEGVVKIYLIDEETGLEKVLDFLTDGEFFGEMALFDEKGRSATAEVVSDEAELLFIYKGDFIKLLKDKSEVSYRLIQTLIKRLREANLQIYQLSFKTVQDRIAYALLKLSDRKYTSAKSEQVTIPLTHEELANFVAVARETVTRTLDEFTKEGLTSIKRSRIIVNLPKLKSAFRNVIYITDK